MAGFLSSEDEGKADDPEAEAAKKLHQSAVAEGTVEIDVAALDDDLEINNKNKRKKPGAAKSQAKGRKSSPSRRSAGGTSATNASKTLVESEADLKTLAPGLQRVCTRIQKVPQCFLCLNEGCFLQPWGRSVDAVPWSAIT